MPETVLATPLPTHATDPWTRREILQQPDTLRATHAVLRQGRAGIEAFVAPLLARPDLRIILTGAGTSAFIGESLAPWLSRLLGRNVEAIATTDIVGAPLLHLRRDAPTLLVSFGRSGNSPESIAAVDLADAQIDDVHHLVITCNAEGALAQGGIANRYVVQLPEATHDRAFAMTSSFTAMTYAALAIFTGIDAMDLRAERIAEAVSATLAAAEQRVDMLAARGFQRVVYLGSGVFSGLAREAALKLLELSDGKVVSAFDSALGFRHGPKTIVDRNTLVVVYLSNDPLTRRYDLDIVEELRADGRAGGVLTIGVAPPAGDAIAIEAPANALDADLIFPFIVPAQLFALHVSLALGLTPDRPNASGTVNRVVQGVRIHAMPA
jgi:tagatose-6-phosphate ketose/aldose isomerase